MKIEKTVQVEVEITADRLGELLAEADDQQLAAAFDRFAGVTAGWDRPRQIQWDYMAEHLTPRARALLVELGEYAEWRLR